MTFLNRRHFVLGVAAAIAAARTSGWPSPVSASAPNLALLDLLAAIPASALDFGTASGQIAAFADVAGQLKSVGVTAPADHNANKAAIHNLTIATNGLVGPDAIRYALAPEWRSTFGFEVFDIDQSLEFGGPPLVRTVYRGRFKSAEISAALKAVGYVLIDRPGAVVWSLSEDESIDIKNPANKLVLSRMNNVALVGDDVLLAAPRLDALKEMLDALSGTKPPAASNEELASMLARLPDLSTCLILGGVAITGEGGPVKALVSGLTYGPVVAVQGPASSSRPTSTLATWNTALLTASEADAAALKASIPGKLASGESAYTKRPYKELFSDWKVQSFSADSIVTVQVTFAGDIPPATWSRFIFQRDIGFLGGS